MSKPLCTVKRTLHSWASLTLPGKLRMPNAWGHKICILFVNEDAERLGLQCTNGTSICWCNWTAANYSTKAIICLVCQIRSNTNLTFQDCRVISRELSLLRLWERSVPFQKYRHCELPDQIPYEVRRRFKSDKVVVLQAQMSLCLQWAGPS